MHIMSDEQYNRLMAMQAYLDDPAPLPMWVKGESRRKGIAADKRERALKILEVEG